MKNLITKRIQNNNSKIKVVAQKDKKAVSQQKKKIQVKQVLSIVKK